jgi:hypothetical protein
MDRFFNAMDDSFEAMVDAIKTGNERGYRFSKKLLREVEQGQQELVQLGRRFARQPNDMRGLYQASVDLARRTAGHSGDLAREWLADAAQAGQDARQTATKLVRANRSAAQALGTAVQEGARDLSERARERMAARRAAAPRPAAKKAAPARRPARRRAARRPARRAAARPAPTPMPMTQAPSTPPSSSPSTTGL